MVRKVGYMPVGEGWPSCCVHPALKLLLVLYVDDFKLAGPRANLKEGWRLLRLHLSIEDATPIGLYLGRHRDTQVVRHDDGASVAVMPYNMEDFLQSCVTRYEELSGGNARLQQARTPFLSENPHDGPAGNPCGNDPAAKCPWCSHKFPYSPESSSGSRAPGEAKRAVSTGSSPAVGGRADA